MRLLSFHVVVFASQILLEPPALLPHFDGREQARFVGRRFLSIGVSSCCSRRNAVELNEEAAALPSIVLESGKQERQRPWSFQAKIEVFK